MNLTSHFTLEELTFSQTAARWGIDNTPNETIIANLKQLCELLEQVRGALQRPLHISSGYRCQELNRKVGGAMNSQHLTGCAADFTAKDLPLDVIMELIITSHIPYQQLIHEFDSWIHISIDPAGKPRKQALRINRSGTRLYE